MTHPDGILASGKTKQIWPLPGDKSGCIVVSSDRISAADGKRMDIIPRKGELSTELACNVFEGLRVHGIPVAYRKQHSSDSFIADHCNMILIEVVARFEVGSSSSYLKRNPRYGAGCRFTEPLIEFFLKTTGGKFNGQTLSCDDPLLVSDPNGAYVAYLANMPVSKDTVVCAVSETDLHVRSGDVAQIKKITRQVALILQSLWKSVGVDLHDFKIEFGYTHNGRLVVADVITNDEWRIEFEGHDVSKQTYRDLMPLEYVSRCYEEVTQLSYSFDMGEPGVRRGTA